MKGIRGTAHPLDTPLILDCIFKNLGVSDLKTCRQVNSVWNETATLAMQSVGVVKINGDSIPQFLELVQSELSTFEKLPFATHYKLRGVRLDHPEFWAFCGNSIKSLHLSNALFDSADAFRHILLQSCPNLENLHLDYVHVRGSVVDEPATWVEPRFPQNVHLKRLGLINNELKSISFLELVSHFPSLEEAGIEDTGDASRIFKSLAICREHNPQKWNIKKITFPFFLEEPESDLRFLLDDSLSLETLNVYIVAKPNHFGVLRNILSAHSTTLKSLRLSGRVAASIFDSPYDTMLEKVVEFTLEWSLIESLRFLYYLPNLKELKIFGCIFLLPIESIEKPLNHWIVSSCTNLTLHLINGTLRENLYQLFRKVPNVEKLKIKECNNQLFAGICEIFPNLVCLELNNSSMNDCGISGLDEKDVARINDDLSLVGRSVTVPRANLSSLKNLKWFRYRPNCLFKNGLCFCAAQCGVLQLPELQHLQVQYGGSAIWNRLHAQFPWRDP